MNFLQDIRCWTSYEWSMLIIAVVGLVIAFFVRCASTNTQIHNPQSVSPNISPAISSNVVVVLPDGKTKPMQLDESAKEILGSLYSDVPSDQREAGKQQQLDVSLNLKASHFTFAKFAAKGELPKEMQDAALIRQLNIDPPEKADEFLMPTLLLSVKNTSNRTIKVSAPFINLKEGYKIELPSGDLIDGVVFFANSPYMELQPQESHDFNLHGPICNLVIKFLLAGGINNIIVESDKKLSKQVSLDQISEAQKYCEVYFKDINYLDEQWKKFGDN